MEPSIQYAKTSDGVSIAYWTFSQGEPLAHMPLPMFTHAQLEWQTPGLATSTNSWAGAES